MMCANPKYICSLVVPPTYPYLLSCSRKSAYPIRQVVTAHRSSRHTAHCALSLSHRHRRITPRPNHESEHVLAAAFTQLPSTIRGHISSKAGTHVVAHGAGPGLEQLILHKAGTCSFGALQLLPEARLPSHQAVGLDFPARTRSTNMLVMGVVKPHALRNVHAPGRAARRHTMGCTFSSQPHARAGAGEASPAPAQGSAAPSLSSGTGLVTADSNAPQTNSASSRDSAWLDSFRAGQDPSPTGPLLAVGRGVQGAK